MLLSPYHTCFPGFIEKEVTAIPLYLSRVRFAIVQGAKNKTHAQWKEYTKDLDDQIKYRYLTYDLAYGNPGNLTWLYFKDKYCHNF